MASLLPTDVPITTGVYQQNGTQNEPRVTYPEYIHSIVRPGAGTFMHVAARIKDLPSTKHLGKMVFNPLEVVFALRNVLCLLLNNYSGKVRAVHLFMNFTNSTDADQRAGRGVNLAHLAGLDAPAGVGVMKLAAVLSCLCDPLSCIYEDQNGVFTTHHALVKATNIEIRDNGKMAALANANPRFLARHPDVMSMLEDFVNMYLTRLLTITENMDALGTWVELFVGAVLSTIYSTQTIGVDGIVRYSSFFGLGGPRELSDESRQVIALLLRDVGNPVQLEGGLKIFNINRSLLWAMHSVQTFGINHNLSGVTRSSIEMTEDVSVADRWRYELCMQMITHNNGYPVYAGSPVAMVPPTAEDVQQYLDVTFNGNQYTFIVGGNFMVQLRLFNLLTFYLQYGCKVDLGGAVPVQYYYRARAARVRLNGHGGVHAVLMNPYFASKFAGRFEGATVVRVNRIEFDQCVYTGNFVTAISWVDLFLQARKELELKCRAAEGARRYEKPKTTALHAGRVTGKE